MQVLVTVGAGYIGSVIVEELINANHSVVVYDSLSKGHLEAVHQHRQLGFQQRGHRPR